MPNSKLLITRVVSVIILIAGISIFVHFFAIPIPNLYLGEVINGNLEKTLILPRANIYFLLCSTRDLQHFINGRVQISNENQKIVLAFDFSINSDPDQAAALVFYLAPLKDSIVAFRKDQIQDNKITLRIKLDNPNKEPIEVRLGWPKHKEGTPHANQ